MKKEMLIGLHDLVENKNFDQSYGPPPGFSFWMETEATPRDLSVIEFVPNLLNNNAESNKGEIPISASNTNRAQDENDAVEVIQVWGVGKRLGLHSVDKQGVIQAIQKTKKRDNAKTEGVQEKRRCGRLKKKN